MTTTEEAALPDYAEADMSDALMARLIEDPDEKTLFADIHKHFYWEMYRFVEEHVQGQFRNDVDDVVQQTFIDLFQARHRIQPGTRLRPYLYQITDNNLKDHLRAAEAEMRDHHLTCSLPPQGPALTNDVRAKALWSAEQSRERLVEFMAELSDEEATALRLMWMDGHTDRETAKIMGKPVSTIWHYSRDAKKRIRKMANQDQGAE